MPGGVSEPDSWARSAVTLTLALTVANAGTHSRQEQRQVGGDTRALLHSNPDAEPDAVAKSHSVAKSDAGSIYVAKPSAERITEPDANSICGAEQDADSITVACSNGNAISPTKSDTHAIKRLLNEEASLGS